MEKFETRGKWWLPEQPRDQVAGILRFDPKDGATLEVIGDELEQHIGIAGLSPQIDLICGFTKEGDAVTLYKSHRIGFTMSTGYLGSSYRVTVVFWGNLFETVEEIVFESMLVNYSYLEDWVGISGLDGYAKQEKSGHINKMEVSYELPAQQKFKIADFSLSFHHEMTLPHFEFKEVHAVQKTFLEIMPDTPRHYDDYQKQILRPTRNFICLGIGRATIPLVVRGKNKDHKLELDNGEIRQRDTVIYYVAEGAGIPIKNLQTGDMLFRFKDMSARFTEHLTTWFRLQPKLEPVLDLYFSLFYIPSIYTHLAFLSLAQALENYHKQMYPEDGIYMPDDDFEGVKAELVKAIPSRVEKAHRASMIRRMEYLNEFSLRNRVKAILEKNLRDYSNILNRLIPNREIFVDRFVTTRNYYTHYDPELKPKAVTDPTELGRLTRRVILVMQLCFLAELGISGPEAEELTKKATSFRNLSITDT